jgi:hypothetical protein
MSQPSLRPQDVLILAKLLTYEGDRPAISQMGAELSISASEIHGALKRLEQSHLIANDDTGGSRPVLQAVEEFLVHGVKYAFPPRHGGVTRGVPTSHAAAPLNQMIVASADLPPVWPHPEGSVRGVSLEPLYRSAPAAALRDPALYELLALIDAMRDGRARERKLAEEELRTRIRSHADDRSQQGTARKRR